VSLEGSTSVHAWTAVLSPVAAQHGDGKLLPIIVQNPQKTQKHTTILGYEAIRKKEEASSHSAWILHSSNKRNQRETDSSE